MIEVKIPKEITDYKIKIIAGFDVRQSLGIAVSFGVCFAVYKLYGDSLSINSISNIVIPIIIPVIGVAFFKYKDFYLEEYIFFYIRYAFLNPSVRKYQEIDITSEIFHDTLEKSKEMTKIKQELYDEYEENIQENKCLEQINY